MTIGFAKVEISHIKDPDESDFALKSACLLAWQIVDAK